MSAPSNQHDPAAAAYESLGDELSALSPDEVMRVNVDVSRAASRALRVTPHIRELLPDIERQLPALPLERLRKLETYALAAWYAHACAWRIRKLSPTRELVIRAKPLRNKLLKAADVFSDAGFIDRTRVTTIRSGQGRLDMAKDMVALAHILQQAWPRIGPNALVTPEDLQQAGDLGQELINAIAHGERALHDQRWAMADRCARAFTLLWRAYDTAQRALVFLRWREGDAWEIAPSLFDQGGGRRKSSKRSTEGSAAGPGETRDIEQPSDRTGNGGDTGQTTADLDSEEPSSRHTH